MEGINFKLVEKNYSIRIKKVEPIKTHAYFVQTRDKKEYFLKLSKVDKWHVDFILSLYSHLKKDII